MLSEIHDFFKICYAQHRNFMCQLNLLNELTVYLFSQIVLIIQTWYQKKKKRLGWFPRDRTLYGSIFCLGGESRMNSSPKMKSHPSMPAWTSTWKNIRRATPPPPPSSQNEFLAHITTLTIPFTHVAGMSSQTSSGYARISSGFKVSNSYHISW